MNSLIKKYSLATTSIGFLIISNFISLTTEKPPIIISKQIDSININDTFLSYFNLGFKRLISSSLWISTVIESDQEHYKKKDLNSWMFLRFNSIRQLEPRFYENYLYGGTYLSIIKDDLPGATLLFNYGLIEYPEDYALLRDAGFHFHFEVGDYNRSYQIYSKLLKFPSSTLSVTSILAKLEAGNGNLETAEKLLIEKYNELEDKSSFIAMKIKENLYSIRAELDLSCLNNKTRENCNKYDLDNVPYLKNNQGIYSAQKEWKYFRVKK